MRDATQSQESHHSGSGAWNPFLAGNESDAQGNASDRRQADHSTHCGEGGFGLWQVSGRSSIGFAQMVELDLQYIRKRSLWFDLVIILRTIKMLFGSRKAY
jgi:lipopolysaccharide/colanic/teichoic acid biosynthesis glycosyltransferase